MKKIYTTPEMIELSIDIENAVAASVSGGHEGFGTSSVDVLDELGGSADGTLNDLIDNMLF